jgi:charged multivesicular body protein 4
MFTKLLSPKLSRTRATDISINTTTQNIQSALDTLEKRGDYLQKQKTKLTNSARIKLKLKNRKGAMFDLKRKKLLEKELSGIENKKLTLETQILALENAQMNEMILDTVKWGSEALEVVHENVNIEEAENLMDDMQEMWQEQDAVNGVLGQPMKNFDNEELLKELESLNMHHAEQQVEGESNKNTQYVVPLRSISKKVEAMKNASNENDDHIAMDSMVS